MGTSSKNSNQTEQIIRLLEEQLVHSNQQKKDLATQIEALNEQVSQLTATYTVALKIHTKKDCLKPVLV